MSNREDMIAEATDLGLDFKGNISNINLAALIAEYKGEPPPLDETPPPGPAVKPEPEVEDAVEPDIVTQAQLTRTAAQKVYAAKRRKIGAAKDRAMKKTIVTITSKDSRENEVTTTAYLSCENEHFSIGRSVPLDIPVELEQCLIENARTCKMPMHRDEVKNGRRTGNKVTIIVPKYTISYSRQDPD